MRRGFQLAKMLIEFEKNILRNFFCQPRSPVILQASEKTMDWYSSTSCSKFGCQSWAMGFASTLLSAGGRGMGCRELREWREKVQGERFFAGC